MPRHRHVIGTSLTRTPAYFAQMGALRFPSAKTTSKSKSHVRRAPTLRELVLRGSGAGGPGEGRAASYQGFLALVEGMLTMDAGKRWTAERALAHPWVAAGRRGATAGAGGNGGA